MEDAASNGSGGSGGPARGPGRLNAQRHDDDDHVRPLTAGRFAFASSRPRGPLTATEMVQQALRAAYGEAYQPAPVQSAPPVTVSIEGFVVLPIGTLGTDVEAAVRGGLLTVFEDEGGCRARCGPSEGVWQVRQVRVWYEGRETVSVRSAMPVPAPPAA